jgi:hypothetical protein
MKTVKVGNPTFIVKFESTVDPNYTEHKRSGMEN